MGYYYYYAFNTKDSVAWLLQCWQFSWQVQGTWLDCPGPPNPNYSYSNLLSLCTLDPIEILRRELPMSTHSFPFLSCSWVETQEKQLV